jgi:uncharacterized membrane protein AbrB (regulator of aidB expression)
MFKSLYTPPWRVWLELTVCDGGVSVGGSIHKNVIKRIKTGIHLVVVVVVLVIIIHLLLDQSHSQHTNTIEY